VRTAKPEGLAGGAAGCGRSCDVGRAEGYRRQALPGVVSPFRLKDGGAGFTVAYIAVKADFETAAGGLTRPGVDAELEANGVRGGITRFVERVFLENQRQVGRGVGGGNVVEAAG
jgi:hypothetical protein